MGNFSSHRLPVLRRPDVEVIVLPVTRVTMPDTALKGTVPRYNQPTAPVAEADWDTLRP